MSSTGLSGLRLSHDGVARAVYRAGGGPAVVVVHEVPGLHPAVADFGRRVAGAGFTAYPPSLFGQPGAPFSIGRSLAVAARLCVSREFTIFADRTSPVIGWLRALAAQAHAECGGPGVGAVGMCFTGGYALAMAVDDALLAPVLSQPATPTGFTRAQRAALGLDAADLTRVRDRTRDDLCVLGLRFSHDARSPGVKFERLRREFGDAFLAVEIDSGPGNPQGLGRSAHSVLTLDLVDEPGHPTRLALDRVLTFLDERLRPNR